MTLTNEINTKLWATLLVWMLRNFLKRKQRDTRTKALDIKQHHTPRASWKNYLMAQNIDLLADALPSSLVHIQLLAGGKHDIGAFRVQVAGA
jgi:hypothetical protein